VISKLSTISALQGYNTHRPQETEAMLDSIGIGSVEELFAAIPASVRLSRKLDLPNAISEWELARKVQGLADKNSTVKTHNSFLGGGAYEHYIPAVVDAIVSRGEFLTSYTPYQPEISQGLLQSLFEYQTSLGAITGLPVVNGSCYDGATALADASWACCLISGKNSGAKLLASSSVWQNYRTVMDSYMQGRGVAVSEIAFDAKTGKIDILALDAALGAQKPAGFLFQSPNAFGIFEDVQKIADTCKKHGVVSVCSYNPLTSGIVTPAGLLGVDIVVCDGQVLGLPLSAGGPSLGVFATRKEYRKYVPGRLVGKVHDINGNLAYALVYEDREQHVAREKATSNICSNQALNALRAVIYLASVGEVGLSKIAALNTRKAHYLAVELSKINGVSLAFSGAFFNEFVISLPKPVLDLLAALRSKKIFAGIDYSGKFGLKNALLVTATEVKTKADMDEFVQQLKELVG
jgi:glycine dehydrogenase subunit 1